MSEQVSIQDLSFTPREQDLVKTFQKCLELDDIRVFTADDFRRYGLDRFFRDREHDTGAFFRKLKLNGLAEAVGWRASGWLPNHGRKVQVWRWKKGVSI